VAEIIANSVTDSHQIIEKIELLEAPVTGKQAKKAEKKKKKQ